MVYFPLFEVDLVAYIPHFVSSLYFQLQVAGCDCTDVCVFIFGAFLSDDPGKQLLRSNKFVKSHICRCFVFFNTEAKKPNMRVQAKVY
jgi:hypothetical protein